MNWSLSILIAGIGSCLIYLPVQAIPRNTNYGEDNSTSPPAPLLRGEGSKTPPFPRREGGSGGLGLPTPAIPVSPELSPEQVREVARSIAVKVLCGDTCGSGILIAKRGQIYTVVTNNHVLIAGDGKPYRIQTPDGRIYAATISRASEFHGDDLGLLQFSSWVSYRLASMPVSSTLAVGDRVFAAGFPVEAQGFVFNSGEISLILDRALGGGYQIGYTNDIQKGMSGGPVLNSRGELVAINAMHAYPLWEKPYVFKDGSMPSASMQQEMTRLSWAVPVQTFLELGGLKSSLRTVIRERPNSSHQPELLW